MNNETKLKLIENLDEIIETQESEIIDEKTVNQSIEKLLITIYMKKQLDEKRKNLVKPFFDQQKEINLFCKQYIEKLESVEKNLKESCKRWFEKNEIKECKIKTENGYLKVSQEWDYEIINVDEIPREYLMVNEKSIKEAVKFGIRNIKGIEIKQKTKLENRIS